MNFTQAVPTDFNRELCLKTKGNLSVILISLIYAGYKLDTYFTGMQGLFYDLRAIFC